MRSLLLVVLAVAVPFATAPFTAAHAQRHSGITSPPTAPPPKQAAPPPPEPIVAVSSGMGPLQFTQTNLAVPDPQVLVRELQSADERVRAAAFTAVGLPAAYLAHGHSPVPHSVGLDFVALGTTTDLDAILTVELDVHIVSAILVPSDVGWRRIANITYATSFADPATNPGTFLRTVRALTHSDLYTAVFHGVNLAPDGDLTENEAHLRVLNDHAVITISFVSRERICEPARLQGRTAAHECEVTERWLAPLRTEGPGHAMMVTATGRVNGHEVLDPISRSRLFNFARGHFYSCQPYVFSDATLRYEPTANAGPCFARPAPPLTAPAPVRP